MLLIISIVWTISISNWIEAASEAPKRKCGLPDDISILPDFAQDEIRAVWKDYVPGKNCEKEQLITDDILAVLEMFDKEFEQEKKKGNTQREKQQNLGAIEKDNEKNTTPESSAIAVDLDYNNFKETEKPRTTTAKPNSKPDSHLLLKKDSLLQPSNIDNVPSFTAQSKSKSGKEKQQYSETVAESSTDDSGDAETNVDADEVGWRVKSRQFLSSSTDDDNNNNNNDDDETRSETIPRTPNQKDQKNPPRNPNLRPFRFATTKSYLEYDHDYDPPEPANIDDIDEFERARQHKSALKPKNNNKSRKSPRNRSEANTDATTDYSVDKKNYDDVKKQFDENLSFLRGVDDDIVEIFQEALHDDEILSERRRMEEIHLLAVSYLTARQLEAFNAWSTKRRKQLGAIEERDGKKEYTSFDAPLLRDAEHLSPEARKALSAITYSANNNSKDSQRNEVLRLPANIRSELREFARSYFKRKT